MILRKQSISLVARLGGAVLLGLALVALPWAPTIAQQPKEQQPSPQQLRRQQIEVLRQLLKSLEQEQQAEEQALRAKNTFVVETLNQPAQPKKTAEGTQFLIEAIVDAQKTAADQQKKLAEDHAKRAKEAEMRLRIKAAQPKAGDVVQAKDEIDQLRAKIAQAESDLGAAQANLVQLQAALDKLALHKSKAQPATGEFFAISLRSAQASDMAKILNDLFSAHPSDKSRITIVPDPRTNTLLIQAAADDLITVRTLIERLDIGTEKKTRN